MTHPAMSNYDEIHAHSLLAAIFNSPREVLASPFLDITQKRCVLAAWASDAFAVEGKPWLRKIPGSSKEVRIGDIMAALRSLDGGDGPPPRSHRMPLPGIAIRTRAIGQTASEMRRTSGRLHPSQFSDASNRRRTMATAMPARR